MKDKEEVIKEKPKRIAIGLTRCPNCHERLTWDDDHLADEVIEMHWARCARRKGRR
jgi:hypothetical protein